MKKQYILSIDIGTSSCKVVLFDEQGNIIGISSGEHKTFFYPDGGAEQRPQEWWGTIQSAVKNIFNNSVISPKDIAVIGVDSQSSAMIAMSKSGAVLYPAMIWTDKRAVREKTWIDENVGQKLINEINGNHNDESNVAVKLMWLKDNHPERYRDTYQVLNATGYLVYQLTGCFSMNISEGGLTQMFDIRKGIWSKELVHAYDLDMEKLPPVYLCHEIVGGVSAQAAEALGIAEGTKVVAGAMDAVSCALGCGVVKKGDSFITGGTVTALGICSDKPIASDSLHVYHHIVPGTWMNVAGADFGGGNYRWFRDQFMQECPDSKVYKRMNELAGQIMPGADKLLFLPSLVGQRCPQWDGNMRGLFFGITPNHGKAHFIRAIMEGNAYFIKEILELQKQEGVISKEITIAGGIARSDIWMQIFADVLDVPLFQAECEEAAAVGNMMNAAFGIGMITSFQEAKEKMQVQRISFREENNHRYEQMYKVYKTLYPALQEQFFKLADLEI